jgi:hypothetical protein
VVKTILLCNEHQAKTFRAQSGLSAREAILVTRPQVLEGVRFTEGDLILEWPGWRDGFAGAQEIVDVLKRCIARGNNAGPQWVSNRVLNAT